MSVSNPSAEAAVRAVLARIDAAWQARRFEGLEDCFDESAVIVGPGHAVYAAGRDACAASYREFATNAAVLEYSDSNRALRVWPDVAVHTCAWRMTYQREEGPVREAGTDQLVLARFGPAWRVVFRYVHFEPAD